MTAALQPPVLSAAIPALFAAERQFSVRAVVCSIVFVVSIILFSFCFDDYLSSSRSSLQRYYIFFIYQAFSL